eukprot:97247-Chlamydomonas_euryale.AAC.1
MPDVRAGTVRSPDFSPYSITRVSSSGRRLSEALPVLDAHHNALRRLQQSENYTVIADSWPDDPELVGVASQPPDLQAMMDANPNGLGSVQASSSSPGEMLCYRVDVGACEVANRCCDVDLLKIEFLVGNSCWGAVEYALVNGGNRGVAYARVEANGRQYTTMKISQLGLPISQAAGTTVCFKLRSSRETSCPTAATLCEGPFCSYSMFNSQQDCCPTSTV